MAVLALAGIGAAGAMGGGSMGHHMMEAGMKPGGHFAERGIDRMLDSVGAIAEQEERIWAIIDGARRLHVFVW